MDLPTTEPPESFQGNRQPSLTGSDTSEGQSSLMAMGASQAASHLRQGAHGGEPQPRLPPDNKAGCSGGAGSPAPSSASAGTIGTQSVHLVFHRELTLDVPPDQLGEAVHAIVHMQPLPVSPRAATSSATSAAPPSLPGTKVLGKVIWPPGSPGGSLGEGQMPQTLQSLQQEPQPATARLQEVGQQQDQSHHRAESPGGSFHSAESDTELAGIENGNSSTASTASYPTNTSYETAVPQAPFAHGSDVEEELQTAPPPPPRPSNAGSMTAPEPASRDAATQRFGQDGARLPLAAAGTTSGSDGFHAPPPTPADTSGASSHMLGPSSGRAPGRSAPASPATPLAGAQPRSAPSNQSPTPPVPVPGQQTTAAAGGDDQQQVSASGISSSASAGSWPGTVPAWRQQQPSADATAPPQRRSRLAVSTTASPSSAQPSTSASTGGTAATAGMEGTAGAAGTAGSPSQGPPAATPNHSPRSLSSDQPQLTEICGPWPPRPPLPQPIAIASPRGREELGHRGSPQLPTAFFHASRGPNWRQLDDGSWVSSAEVDWYQLESGAAVKPGEALLHSPLVGAASMSPPLSPVSTRLLARRYPSTELRRGPQRAASLGLSPMERHPSLLSPERQQAPFCTPSIPAILPAATSEIEPAEAESSLSLPPEQLPMGLQARLETINSGVSSSESGSGDATGSGPASPHPRPLQQHLLPVLNASPDVTPGAANTAMPSPFPHRAGNGGGTAGGFSAVGGLPLDHLEKRDRRRSADYSPREAYSMEEGGGWRGTSLQTPLLPAPLLTESEAEEGLRSPRVAAYGSLWSSTALLVTPLLGAGLLAAPRCFALLGLVAGSISLALVVLAAFVSLHFLITATRRVAGRHMHGLQAARYAEVVRAVLGSTGAAVADITLAVHCFGLMIASFIVLGDILVGSGSDGLLGGWGGDRATAVGVLSLVVLAPMTCYRRVSTAAGASALAVVASCMAAAATLALTILAATKHSVHHMSVWPDWQQLHASGWFVKAVQLVGVVPVLLVATVNHHALHPVMLRAHPRSPVRMHAAGSLALLYGTVLLALFGTCCYALFGSDVQADVLLDFTPKALTSLAGDALGRAAYLLVQLAFVVTLAAGFPLLMVPFRDALWRVLFWQPLVGSAGFYLVTLLALAGALWASLVLQSGALWQLISLLGSTTGALLALVLPGLVAAGGYGAGRRTAGVVLAVLGVGVGLDRILRLFTA